jgi:hypothetical protein
MAPTDAPAPLLPGPPPPAFSPEMRWLLLTIREGLLVIVRNIERACRLPRG